MILTNFRWLVVYDYCYCFPLTDYASIITELLQNSSLVIRSKALQLLASKVSTVRQRLAELISQNPVHLVSRVEANISTMMCLLEPLYTFLTEFAANPSVPEETSSTVGTAIQFALVAMSSFVTSFATSLPYPVQNPQSISAHQARTEHFVRLFPVVCSFYNFPSKAVQSSAFLCTCSFIKCIGVPMLEHLPTILPAALSQLQTFTTQESSTSEALVDDDDHNGLVLLNISCLTTLNETIQVLPSFLTPYLPSIFQLLFHPSMHQIKELHPPLSTALSLLPSLVEPVNLLPPLVLSYKFCLQHGTASLKPYFQFLSDFCSSLSASSVRSYSNSIFKFFLHAFDMRQTIRISSYTKIDMEIMESHIADSFLAFVLKLNEMELKSFWLKLIEWLGPALTLMTKDSINAIAKSNENRNTSKPVEDEENEVVHSKATIGIDQLDVEESSLVFERSLMFFKVVQVLSAKLKNIFVPYSLYSFDHAIAYLQSPQYWNPVIQSAIEDNQKILAEGKKPSAKKTGAHSIHSNALSDYIRFVSIVLKSLEYALQYDSEHIYAKEQFDRLVPCYSDLLTVSLDALMTPAAIRSYDESSHYHKFLAQSLTPALLSLASHMSTFHLWKPLQHSLLLQTRNTSSHVRFAALRMVTALFQHLGQSYLVMLPETLPFISELMEDSEQHVEAEVQRLIRTLEELSGESLETYLQ